MAWSFNPFTGNLDLVGSGGGTVVFEGEVETFADLPETIGDPPVGSSYLVRTSTGVWLVNRRQAGIWIRKNNTGVRATDWEYGGDYPVNSVNGQTGNVSLTASSVGAAAATHASTHHTGGTDAIAPASIGAQSLFTTTTNGITGNTTITAGRALIYQVTTSSAVTADINLPSSGHQSGDVIVVRSTSPFITGTTLTIKSGTGATLDTITASNQSYRYIASGTGPNAWQKVLVDTHTHAAADVTSGVLDNARVNFAAPAAIGSTTPAAGTFTNLVANTELQVPSAAAPSPSAGDIYRVSDQIRYRDSGNTERALLNSRHRVLTGNATAATGEFIAANTTAGAFTLTLPATPDNGDTISILDYAGTFNTNNLTIARNGSNIESLAENMDCNIRNAAFTLVFVGSTIGWKVVPYFGSSVNFSSPNAIGNSVPNTGAFTTLTANSLTSGTGAFNNLTATPSSGSALTLTGGTVTASAPVLDATQTWNNAAVTFTGLRFNLTPTASDHRSLVFSLEQSSTPFWGIQSVIGVPATEAVRIFGGSRGIRIGPRVTSGAGSSDFIAIRWQQNTFTMLDGTEFGWSTLPYDSAPNLALHRDASNTLAQRNGTNAQTFRLYNTFTSTTNFERLNIIAQSAASVIIGTEKGSGGGSARGLELRTDNVARINISATGGIGFFGAAAAAQPTAVADATDAATVITQLNALLSRMRTLGLIAT